MIVPTLCEFMAVAAFDPINLQYHLCFSLVAIFNVINLSL